MIKCPHCFQNLGSDVVLYGCGGRCEAILDTQFSDAHGAERMSKPLTVVQAPTDPKAARNWAPPASVPCRVCSASSNEVCRYCHYPLPPNWRAGDTTCIALAGARSTGKSVYVGVLIKQLEQLVHQLGSTMEPIGETQRIYKVVYEEPLFVTRRVIPPTGAANAADAYQREPMIFGLGRLRGSQRPRFLAFRDVAGEDLESHVSGPHFGFYKHASAVLFLFDPTQVSEVREELKGRLNPDTVGMGDPQTVWQNVLRLRGNSRALLAVAMSKFDTLQSIGAGVSVRTSQGRAANGGATDWPLRLANAGAAFNRESNARPGEYDYADGELLHEEIRTILINCRVPFIVNALENPASGAPILHRYFAVSALGAQSDINGQNVRGIAPFRVLDPVKWVLAEEGVLEMARR